MSEPTEPKRFGLIIGAMKCGTTTLFNHLSQHPQVAASRIKEPSYFCGEDYRPAELKRYRELWDWQPGVHRVAIEASANYTKRPLVPDCPERIAECEREGVEFRFLYCVRNPLDRITSHIYHGLYPGWTKPLEEEIPDHTINVSRYAMQLDAYVSLFGRDRIHIIVLEEFAHSPQESLRHVCEFLGIEPGFRFPELQKSYNESSDHYVDHPLWDRLRSIDLLRRLARAVPVGIRRSAFRATGRHHEVRRELTDSERLWILSKLKPDLVRLRTDYGIDPEATWGLELP